MIVLSELSKQVHRIAKEHGWWEPPVDGFPVKLALMHSELSEALEEYRNGRALNEIYYAPDSDKPEGIPIELADCIIRILDWCQANDIDIEVALTLKIAYNETRPHRHGGKKL